MTNPFVGESEFREWLESNDFRIYSSYKIVSDIDDSWNECNWYACRWLAPESRRCECNDDKPGLQLVIRPYRAIDIFKSRTASFEITGETKGVWYNLKAYSINIDVVPEKLDEVSKSLVRAWDAIIP
jgi:hypothetical protein